MTHTSPALVNLRLSDTRSPLRPSNLHLFLVRLHTTFCSPGVSVSSLPASIKQGRSRNAVHHADTVSDGQSIWLRAFQVVGWIRGIWREWDEWEGGVAKESVALGG